MFLTRTLGLMLRPDREWESIRRESHSLSKLYLQHIMVLALIPVVAGYIGTTQIGWQIGNGPLIKLTEGSALRLCAIGYLAMLVGVFVLGKFIDFFAATYGVKDQEPKGVVLAAYIATPIFIGGAAACYPDLLVNMSIGLVAVGYSVYLLYEGVPILMGIPSERGFLFASSILTVGLVMLVALIAISVVIWSLGIGPVYTT